MISWATEGGVPLGMTGLNPSLQARTIVEPETMSRARNGTSYGAASHVIRQRKGKYQV